MKIKVKFKNEAAGKMIKSSDELIIELVLKLYKMAIECCSTRGLKECCDSFII